MSIAGHGQPFRGQRRCRLPTTFRTLVQHFARPESCRSFCQLADVHRQFALNVIARRVRWMLSHFADGKGSCL